MARLEDGLSKLDGVENAEVNFGTEKASVDFDPEKTNIQELRKQVSKLRYRVIGEEGDKEKALSEVSKVTLSGSMACAAFVRRIGQALGSIAGVSDASVNLATNRATAGYDPVRVAL